MAYASSNRRRSSSTRTVLFAAGALALAAAGFVVGGGNLPDGVKRFFHGKEAVAHATAIPDGYVMVPISIARIDAYTRIAREHIFDAKTNAWAETAQPRKSLPDDVILDRAKVLGRVLRTTKSPGYVFRERDFLPEGTRPGLVGGIPSGKRGYRIPLEKIPGLYGLNAGDRFDLIAAFNPQDGAEKELSKVGGIYADALILNAKLNASLKQAHVKVIVQNGVVVEPTTLRQVPYQSNSLTQGASTKTKPVQEVFVALAPEEVSPLEQALAFDAHINCVPRSGQPDDPVDSKTPELAVTSPLAAFTAGGTDSASGMRFVETIHDGKRELVPVPAKH